MKESSKYRAYYFIVYMGMAAFFSLFAIYLNEIKGYEESYINFLLAIPPFVAIIFQPLWGAASDVLNSKKILLGVSLTTIAITLYAMQWIENSLFFIVVFFIYAIAFCGFVPLTDALTMNFIHQNPQKGVEFGSIRLWGSLGFAVATVLSAKIAATIGLSSIFTVSCIGYLLALIFLAFIKEYKNKTVTTNYLHDIKKLFKQKNYSVTLLYLFIFIGTIFAADPSIMLVMRAKGITISQIGWVTFLSVVSEIPALFYSKRIVKKHGIFKCMYIVTALLIGRYLILSFANSLIVFALMQMVRGGLIGFSFAMFVDYISDIVSESMRSSGIAIYTTVTQGLGQSFFLILVGILVTKMAPSAVFLCLAALNVLGFFTIGYLKRTA